MAEGTRDRDPEDVAAVAGLRAAAQRLAAILATYQATREKDWRLLCRSPLANAVEDLTSPHGPFALDADQARCVKEVMHLFSGLLPEAMDELRLCPAAHGLDVIVDRLAAADSAVAARRKDASAGAEVRRYFAQESQEAIAPYRRPPRRHTGWVV